MNLLGIDPIVEKYNVSSIRILYSGGAILSSEIDKAVHERIPNSITRLIYGMVELSYATHQTDDHCKEGSVGALQPGTYGKIVDFQTGQSLGPNQMGETCFKGDVVMKGYIGQAEMDNVFDADGWFHSGDIGYYDENEDWFLVGRIVDLVAFKGRKFAPYLVEKILLEHPAVSEASVVGLPHRELDELPVAFIVLNPEYQCTEEEIIHLVAGLLIIIKL